ncbi:hypothetical protein [Francisella sp. SYW-9]|uniref:hypothetical protein n=1 Tax=Francisella sp. SYW-9 TaxID=2610888 RepID=UPI00123C9483|nr:hypothetical protein [Francisella sp. SYW-9]
MHEIKRDKQESLYQDLLKYFSGLYSLKLSPINCGKIGYKISDSKDVFIELHCEASNGFNQLDIILDNKENIYTTIVESIELKNFRKLRFKVTDNNEKQIPNHHFKQIIIDDIKIIPYKYDPNFTIDNLEFYKSKLANDKENYLNILIIKHRFTPIKITVKGPQKYIFSSMKHVCLSLNGFKGDLQVLDSELLEFETDENSKLKSIPYFDDKSSISHSLNIDKITFDNLLKIDGDSLEFSRLAEFFNRNNAYMEAQQLHRHYLLAKAKESLKKESKEDKKTNKSRPCFCKKWTGLSGLINIYDLINGCGTSFVKPIICMFFIWIANVVILQYQFIDYGTEVFYHSINNILPLAGIFISANDIKQPFVILALKLTSVLATLLWFLIALQVRKLLRLKE